MKNSRLINYLLRKQRFAKIVCILISLCIILAAYLSMVRPYIKTPLVDAINTGNLANVQDVLSEGADVNHTYTRSPFFHKVSAHDYASEYAGNSKIPEYLLNCGANIDYRNFKGQTWLMNCAAIGATENCKFILQYNPDINLRDWDGRSALDHAILNHHPEVVQCLINAGAPVTQSTLTIASETLPSAEEINCSAYQIVFILTQQLLLLGEDPQLPPLVKAVLLGDYNKICATLNDESLSNEDIEIASFFAAAYCDVETLKLFEDKGVSFYSLDSSWVALPHAHYAAACGNVDTLAYIFNAAREDGIDFDGQDLLEDAVDHNEPSTTEYLVQQFVEPDQWTLIVAAKNGYLECIKVIAENDTNISKKKWLDAINSAVIYSRNDVVEYILTIIPFTSQELNELCNGVNDNNTDMLKLLCQFGAVPEKCEDSNYILGKAVIAGDYDIAEYLLQRGISTCTDLDTALYEAVSYGYPDIVELLLTYGADVNYRNSEGISVLMLAAGLSNLITDHLIENEANVNVCDENGVTPLMYAAAAGKTYCVETLLAAGADPDATDNQGRTARSYARKSHHPEIVKILKNASAVT